MNKLQEILQQINNQLSEDFWRKPDFIISTVFNIVGLCLSFGAYWEANKAKKAAIDAASSVKAISVSLELTEIVQKLDHIDMDIKYPVCRALITETSRRTKRLTAFYRDDPELSSLVTHIDAILDQITLDLQNVRPYKEDEEESFRAVYWAVEGSFSVLSSNLGKLIGSVENRTHNH